MKKKNEHLSEVKRIRINTALLAFFLGFLGAHKFYLKKPFWGVIYFILPLLLLGLAPLAYLVVFVISILEGVYYLLLKNERFKLDHLDEDLRIKTPTQKQWLYLTIMGAILILYSVIVFNYDFLSFFFESRKFRRNEKEIRVFFSILRTILATIGIIIAIAGFLRYSKKVKEN